METSTTVKRMLAGNRIFVPSYQRAYSWETESETANPTKQVNVFLSDLQEYNKSQTDSRYYFGHFLFEEKSESEFGIIDGQQRLTTIVIFLSALFKKLKSIRPLTENEKELKEDMVLRGSAGYRFETVDYDSQLFKDYIINQTKTDKNGLETVSAKRIVEAFDFFDKHFSDKNETYLKEMLDTISNATCTTHPVKDESEAIQMFIFQNNRGKKPSNLEIIKAQFMFNVHLSGGQEKDELLEEIKNRFEKIYNSISHIEYNINEDEVLNYTLRVYFNSLSETNAVKRINDELSKPDDNITFIREFTQALADSFNKLTLFFNKDEKNSIQVHSLVTLGGISLAIPFIIKAYKFDLSEGEKNSLYNSLESMVLRHRLIGTRAEIVSRLNDVYQKFTKGNPTVQPIIDRIQWLKETKDWWWAYWNNDALERAVQGEINPSIVKFLLWKYENHLESQGKAGYSSTRFDSIVNPELEHIAPQTPPKNPVEAGYPEYDEEFKNQYLNCLGNYLLLSKSHNCSEGNKPFSAKRESYTQLYQQREIQEMTSENQTWTRELIQKRKDKIIEFLMKNI